MNQPQLLGYIQDPSLLAKVPAADLEHLVSEFPYCQVTHLLYTKALYEQKNILYHKQLKNTAAHVSDRSVLYWLISGNATDQASFDTVPSVVAGLAGPGTTPTPRIKETPLPAKEQFGQETGSGDLVSRLNELSGIRMPDFAEIGQRLKDIEKEHESRIHMIAREYLDLRLQRQAMYFIEQQILEDQKTALQESGRPQEEKEQTGMTGEDSAVDEKNVGEDSTPSKSDLIERFIVEAPAMPRPKKEFFSPVNMAHKSTMDSEDLVSETLAEVHLKQGNIQKAVKIYERLCLIIPEKSAYFAARIENIKKENNLL